MISSRLEYVLLLVLFAICMLVLAPERALRHLKREEHLWAGGAFLLLCFLLERAALFYGSWGFDHGRVLSLHFLGIPAEEWAMFTLVFLLVVFVLGASATRDDREVTSGAVAKRGPSTARSLLLLASALLVPRLRADWLRITSAAATLFAVSLLLGHTLNSGQPQQIPEVRGLFLGGNLLLSALLSLGSVLFIYLVSSWAAWFQSSNSQREDTQASMPRV